MIAPERSHPAARCSVAARRCGPGERGALVAPRGAPRSPTIGHGATRRARPLAARALRRPHARGGARRGDRGGLLGRVRRAEGDGRRGASAARLLPRRSRRDAVCAAGGGRPTPRRARSESEAPRTLVLAATDPANPYGATLPWPARGEREDEARRPQRAAGALVVLHDGALAGWLGRGGESLLSPSYRPTRGCARRPPPRTLAQALAGLVESGGRRALLLTTIDGEAAGEERDGAASLKSGGVHRRERRLVEDQSDASTRRRARLAIPDALTAPSSPSPPDGAATACLSCATLASARVARRENVAGGASPPASRRARAS